MSTLSNRLTRAQKRATPEGSDGVEDGGEVGAEGGGEVGVSENDGGIVGKSTLGHAPRLREIINIRAAEFALSIDFKQFQSYCKDTHGEDERKKQFMNIRKFCSDALNNNGERFRSYYYPPGKRFGRRSCPDSIQPIDRHFRGLLCRGLHTDLDMDNCHPTILMWICDMHKIPCPYLKDYVENRDVHLTNLETRTGMDRDAGKRLFLISTNSEEMVTCDYPFFMLYDTEMKVIQQQIAQLQRYAFIKPHVEAKMKIEERKREQKKKAKRENYHGVFVNLVLCHHEGEFMDVSMKVLMDNGYEPSVLMHDGCMIHGDHYPWAILREKVVESAALDVGGDGSGGNGVSGEGVVGCGDGDCDGGDSGSGSDGHGDGSVIAIEIRDGTLNEAEWADHFPDEKPKTSIRDDVICPLLEKSLTGQFGIDMKWSMKFHTTRLICPDKWAAAYRPYPCVRDEWMRKLVKVGNTYVEKVEDEGEPSFHMMKRQELLDTYEGNSVCSTAGILTSKGKEREKFASELEKTAFMPLFIKDEKLPFFRKMEYYPDDSKRPPDHFNLWTGFRVERMSGEYVPNEAGADELEAFVHDCICDGHEDNFNFLMDWKAHMFLYPTERAPAPALAGGMGCGKGTYADFLRALLDKRQEGKVLETSEPEKHVWGDFNPLMQHAFLIFLDEVDGENMAGFEKKIKNIQMNGSMPINPKGINPFVIRAFHRYLFATNNIDNVVKMEKGERRKVPIRCSDAFIPLKEYFVRIRALFNDEAVLRTFHARLLKRTPPMRWNPEDLPKSEFAENLKQSTASDLLVEWLQWLVREDLAGDGEIANDFRLEEKKHLKPIVDENDGAVAAITMTTKQLLWTLEDFARNHNMHHRDRPNTEVKLGCRLKNRAFPGVSKADVGKFKGYSAVRLDVGPLKNYLFG